MLESKVGGVMGRPANKSVGPSSAPNTIKIEHTRNEGNTVELLSNIKVGKITKKKPKKINF